MAEFAEKGPGSAAATGRWPSVTVPRFSAGAVRARLAAATGENFIAAAALSLTAIFALYFRMPEFGLYEDDLNQTRFWGRSFAEMSEYVAELFASGAGGRPIGLTLLRGGFWAGDRLGGVPTLYAVGFLVIVTNAFLTFKIARMIAPASIAILAGLMFIVFPADTLKFSIVRGLAVQPSLTLGLGAILLYRDRRFILAYALAALSVGVYEFGILPFFVAPFLILEPWRSKLRRVVAHISALAGVMAAIILLRMKFAPGHLTELSPLSADELVEKFVVALTIGPWTSFKGFFSKPQTFLQELEPWHLVVVAGVMAVSIWGLRRLWREDWLAAHFTEPGRLPFETRVENFFGRPSPWLLIFVGVAAWVISYSMAISESRFPPDVAFGRTTSVHTAATFGASLTFAGLIWLAFRSMARAGMNPKRVAAPIVAFYLAILGGFHAVVQSNCIESWVLQKKLWRQIVEQTPDWQDGTVIIIDYPSAPNNRYVYTMSWATAVVAQNMFEFPRYWKDAPTVVFTTQLTTTAEVINGQLWLLRRSTWPRDGRVYNARVDPKKVIVFRVYSGDMLKREQSLYQFRNWKVRPGPRGRPAAFATKPLYDLLVGDPDCRKTSAGAKCSPALASVATKGTN